MSEAPRITSAAASRSMRLPHLLRGVVLAFAGAFPVRAADSAPPPASVLLIVTDDQGAQAGCLGTRGLATPHLDALAARGVLFETARCPFPSCSPSRTSMMTGLYPHAHRVTANVHEHLGTEPSAAWSPAQRQHNDILSVPDVVPTLIERLKEAGYRTGITSKFHMSPQARFPFDAWVRGNGGKDVEGFIRGSGDRPFFLFHNIRSPHRPFLQHVQRAGRPVVDPSRVDVPAFLPDIPAIRLDWAEHLTAVEVADAEVGEALAALERSGRADRTVVLFAGDNGPAYPRGKYTAYDFGLRVPVIACGPGVRQGVRTKALASLVDVMPTVLDYAGLEPSKPVHGVSWRPVLEGRPGSALREVVVGEVQFGHGPDALQERGATDGRLHYVRRRNTGSKHALPADGTDPKPWGNRAYEATLGAKETHPEPYRLLKQWEDAPPAEELFDLGKDPWCTKDVATDPAYAEGLSRMRRALDRWIVETGDAEMQASAGGGR